MRWHERVKYSFPIRGWMLESYNMRTEEDWDFNEHTFDLVRGHEHTQIKLCTSKPDHGVYNIGTSKKVLIEHGVPGANYPKYPHKLAGVAIITRHEIWADILRAGLDKGLVGEPDESRAQIEVERQVALSPWFRRVDPWNLLDVMMTRSLIHIDVSGESRNVQDRILDDWQAKIDPLSTPQGDRILQTYQMARGSTSENGRITPGKSLFGAGMESCLVFPENNRPLRLLIARTALQFRELLVCSEQPMVRHHSYEDWMLSGRHLLTAVMSHPWNYEDCIVVSREAAAKLECFRFKTFSLYDTQPLSCNLQPGMHINEGRVLAKTTNPDGPTIEIACPDKIMDTVFDVSLLHTRVVGQPGYKAHVTLVGKYDAVDGTKICTRHGNKGVIRIADNMPKTADGRQIEVIISPESIMGKRRCFGTLVEMAANRKAMDTKTTINTKHLDGSNIAKSLYTEGYGNYTKLDNGRDVYVGPLYWVRTNKHAQDAASAKDDVVVSNFRGLVPDTGKIGGQRFGFDIAQVLQAKGLGNVAEEIYNQNVNPNAIAMMQDLCSCLLGVQHGRKDSQVQQTPGGLD